MPVDVVRARRPHGWVGLRMYIVYTQTSGCVEDVENHYFLASRCNVIITSRHTVGSDRHGIQRGVEERHPERRIRCYTTSFYGAQKREYRANVRVQRRHP